MRIRCPRCRRCKCSSILPADVGRWLCPKYTRCRGKVAAPCAPPSTQGVEGVSVRPFPSWVCASGCPGFEPNGVIQSNSTSWTAGRSKTQLFSICNTFGAKPHVRMALPLPLHFAQLGQKDAG